MQRASVFLSYSKVERVVLPAMLRTRLHRCSSFGQVAMQAGLNAFADDAALPPNICASSGLLAIVFSRLRRGYGEPGEKPIHPLAERGRGANPPQAGNP